MSALATQSEKLAGSAESRTIFGSFFLGDTELAINIEHIQEVVNLPKELSPMPLAPDYLMGIFNLRGTIIPVVNLRKLLNFSLELASNTQKIAILDFQGALIGVSFDTTGEVLRPKLEEQTEFHYQAGATQNLIKGALKMGEEGRVLQILDVGALVEVQNLPQLREEGGPTKHRRRMALTKVSNRKKCITFLASDMRFAFEITGIHEIVKVPEIQQSPMESPLCRGMIKLRGQIIPVISFAKLLHREDGPVTSSSADQRIIIIRKEDEHFGLLVDAVDSIGSYAADEVMAIPLLSRERTEMFKGAVPLESLGDVILLNEQSILSSDEISAITKGHSTLYKRNTVENEESNRGNGKKQVYISFKINHLFGIPITQVKEIIEFTDKLFLLPGSPAFIKGVLNLRGELITIVDARLFFSMTPSESDAELQKRKILVVQNENERLGLIVDSVESILGVTDQSKLELPKFLTSLSDSSMKDAILEVFETAVNEEARTSLMVLNVPTVFQNMRADYSKEASSSTIVDVKA